MPVNRIPAKHADMGQTVSTSGLLPVVGVWKIKRVWLQRHDFIGYELEGPAWYKYYFVRHRDSRFRLVPQTSKIFLTVVLAIKVTKSTK